MNTSTTKNSTIMKPYVIGIDIGGTNTVFGIVDARGVVIASSSIKTLKHADVNDYIDELYTSVTRLLEAHDAVGKVSGIGIGAPNANYYTGTIEKLVNIPWPTPLPLAQMVSEKFGIPVAITNDANAAAIGEMTYGAARGMKNFIMITLGTGVGSGIVINGQVVYGNDGFAGELGHLIVKRNNGRLCGCGRTGCLEAYCSATGVARTAREFLETRTDPSELRSLDIDSITSKDVYDAAVKGDKLAIEIYEYTGKILGEAFADFTVFSSPEAIIIFGGLAKSGDLLLKPLREAMEKSMFHAFKGKVKVILSELKEADAAVLGASALGWEAKMVPAVTPDSPNTALPTVPNA
ncbi:MAG: ROK family protein [Bacteroides sp.]|nr:ROK family protein [Bacteroides sp.]MBD5271554.1 ROK family protein [Bacteroides sp.]MBD5333286.1 ROK family protein [Bacteroides sp.]